MSQHQAAQQLTTEQLRHRTNQLAADVGRLRRRLHPDSSHAHLVERIAGHVEDLSLMLEPTAAELALYLSGLDDDKYAEAIRIVDARHKSLQQRLGQPDGC